MNSNEPNQENNEFKFWEGKIEHHDDGSVNRRVVSLETELFKEQLESSGLPVEITHEVRSQLLEADKEDTNLLFVCTEGDYVITGIFADDGIFDTGSHDEPIIFAGASKCSIIAAFSRKRIIEEITKAEKFDNQEELPPGLTDSREYSWMKRIESMAAQVQNMVRINQPERWIDKMNTQGEPGEETGE